MSASKIPAVGSRAKVLNGSALHTTGGLYASDLKRHNGRIVSRKASAAASRNRNLGASLLPKGSHAFVPGGATATGGAARVVRRRALPTCHRGKSVHCGRTCVPVGAACHKKRYLKR